jgi:hypothetical protein
VATTAASFSRSRRAGATPAIERIDPLTGEAALGGSPFARWPGFDLVFSFPWPGRARSRHRLVLERALAERPPETARGLTSETTCVPRDRDAQPAARSARRARAPRLSQSRGNERKSRRGGCCRCSSAAAIRTASAETNASTQERGWRRTRRLPTRGRPVRSTVRSHSAGPCPAVGLVGYPVRRPYPKGYSGS